MADLERILQQLHDSEINAEVQTFFDAGMRIGASAMDQGSALFAAAFLCP
jgi:hypothetical protein